MTEIIRYDKMSQFFHDNNNADAKTLAIPHPLLYEQVSGKGAITHLRDP